MCQLRLVSELWWRSQTILFETSKPETEFFLQGWKSSGYEGSVSTTFSILCLSESHAISTTKFHAYDCDNFCLSPQVNAHIEDPFPLACSEQVDMSPEHCK